MPEDRPYNLGSTQPEQAAGIATSQDRTAYLRPRSDDAFQQEARSASYGTQDRYMTRPVSAYAASDPRIPSELLTGRGLY